MNGIKVVSDGTVLRTQITDAVTGEKILPRKIVLTCDSEGLGWTAEITLAAKVEIEVFVNEVQVV